VDFKNVQRRVYDALNVLNAMDIIRKDRNLIFFNPHNTIIPENINFASQSEEDEYYLQEKERVIRRQRKEIVSIDFD
jgi:hypothetical protein